MSPQMLPAGFILKPHVPLFWVSGMHFTRVTYSQTPNSYFHQIVILQIPKPGFFGSAIEGKAVLPVLHRQKLMEN